MATGFNTRDNRSEPGLCFQSGSALSTSGRISSLSITIYMTSAIPGDHLPGMASSERNIPASRIRVVSSPASASMSTASPSRRNASSESRCSASVTCIACTSQTSPDRRAVRSLSRECRVSGMEAPETVKDGSDAIGRRKPGRAGYRADGGKISPPCQTPFTQRPVSSLSARRSETKGRIRGTSHSNVKPTSYNTH